VLPGGNFEDEPNSPQQAWAPQETTLDDVDLVLRRVTEVATAVSKEVKKDDNKDNKKDGKKDAKKDDKKDKKEPPGPRQDLPIVGKQCLMLQIKPKHPEAVPQALERTFLALNSPAASRWHTASGPRPLGSRSSFTAACRRPG
jgi:hypothetical protein